MGVTPPSLSWTLLMDISDFCEVVTYSHQLYGLREKVECCMQPGIPEKIRKVIQNRNRLLLREYLKYGQKLLIFQSICCNWRIPKHYSLNFTFENC